LRLKPVRRTRSIVDGLPGIAGLEYLLPIDVHAARQDGLMIAQCAPALAVTRWRDRWGGFTSAYTAEL